MPTQSFVSGPIRSALYNENTEALTVYYSNGKSEAFYSVPPVTAEQIFAMSDPAHFISGFVSSYHLPLAVTWMSLFRRHKHEPIHIDHFNDWIIETGSSLRYR